ncbi:collagen alpha-1(III) chain-like [Ursus maritimus]|uniref:Collagen alpha-1(III) chain-like n=1 Tax=Ursus maritimus TaxID=29073 RepID=A0A8M1FGA1_URSMA|nr:collagen alpha-1(III) chain-like [Ursus maritimus]
MEGLAPVFLSSPSCPPSPRAVRGRPGWPGPAAAQRSGPRGAQPRLGARPPPHRDRGGQSRARCSAPGRGGGRWGASAGSLGPRSGRGLGAPGCAHALSSRAPAGLPPPRASAPHPLLQPAPRSGAHGHPSPEEARFAPRPARQKYVACSPKDMYRSDRSAACVARN